MPPKPKFTREEIIETALQLVSERGMSALTARDLGERLGSSARPIFTLFKNMEEVQKESARRPSIASTILRSELKNTRRHSSSSVCR